MARTDGRLREVVRGTAGQAVVEFALVLPVVVLLVLGIVEFGRVYGDFTILQAAAREAVRVAATGGDDAAVVERARQAAPGLDPAALTVEIERDAGERLVTVRLSYPVAVLKGAMARLLGSELVLRTSAVMAYDVGD
ncbi:MAG: pilus assembly protein [Clostridia bacterium]|nr:pilus assembly protein [Clostridia bacterium]